MPPATPSSTLLVPRRAPASTIGRAVSPPMPRAAPEISATFPSSRFIAGAPQAVPRSYYPGSRAENSLPGPRSVFELHTLLHAGPRTNTLAPGLQMLQTGIVGERLAAGINWVDRQIGGGDFVAGQIWRLGKLLLGKAPQIDKAVLVKLDRRIRHLFRHPRAEEEDGLVDRRIIGGAFGHPLEHPYPGYRIRRQELAGLFAEIHQDRPRLRHGQGLTARPLGIDQGRDARSRVDLQIVDGLLVALAQIEHMDLARNAAFIDRDRGPLSIAGAGGEKLHFSPSLID